LTDEPKQDEHGSGVVGAVSRVGSQMVHSLAPQFIAMLLANVVFMGAFVWYVNQRAEHSVDVITRLLDNCLRKP